MKELFAKIPNRRAIINRPVIADQIAELAEEGGDAGDLRRKAVAILKKALTTGRMELRRRMLEDETRGKQLARAYAFLTDQIVRLSFDFAARVLYPRANPTQGERLSLCAVGGYGRGEMAPHSDVDILFITPYKPTPWTEQVVEATLYMLWDLRLKVGHASRTIPEIIRYAREDLTIRTALLEARYVWGDEALYDEARAAFYRDVIPGTEQDYVRDKLAERDQRHKRMGDSRYVVEPNLKEGKGGLRDLHTLFWIGKYMHRTADVSELVEKGLLRAGELRQFLKAEEFLWSVRCHLHDLVGRADERLTFDVQRELAARLKYADRPGASGVERFMKHYFLIAKQVGDLTRQFLAHLEESQKKRPLWRLPALKLRSRKLAGFVLADGRISAPSEDFFRQEPIRLLQLFHLADQHGVEIHPQTVRQVARDASMIGTRLREDREANRLFLEILTSRNSPEKSLRLMNEVGVFGRFVPDFGRVVAQMQYDMYHHYTVDEHTIRAIGLLSRIEKGELKDDHPTGTELMQKMVSRRVLYVAVLLHDIAKGRKGDHSELGAEVALRLCPRFGLTAAETETVSWLVRYHLLMSNVAFKRDLADFKTILDFADQVQSPERLKLLFLLTCVDIRAVGPGVWNGWKGQLLRELYAAAEEVLRLGHKTVGRQERINAKQDQLAEQLKWSERRFKAYRTRFFDAYWIAEPQDVLALNAEQVHAADKAKKPLSISTVVDENAGTTLVSLYAADHPGLFYRLAGAISLAGANILGARIHTTRDGMALDNITIECATGGAFNEPDQILRLEQTVAETLAGRVKLKDRLAAKPLLRARAEVFHVETNVLIDNMASNRYTVVEINATDRPALLFSLTSIFYQAKVTIHSAHIATYGERAVDVFYITDLTGGKITNANRLKALERRLLAAIDGTDGEEEVPATSPVAAE
ncbi:[protein-PII] uridylyltransferase [Pedomonas mirosovicensis]|uniref:[protein-PII] uridylyltransferase n=1 Tax=Pedomonas mirosovicensis TaxID=2908641 RepID=UPI002167B247|nr:[protein-PII] uridylyltransferase [Pedomonas mirosovicensis]MCH8684099.1 [protein-PII] uridylyltransferase [Pedomonas mirosovicensis]